MESTQNSGQWGEAFRLPDADYPGKLIVLRRAPNGTLAECCPFCEHPLSVSGFCANGECEGVD